MLMKDGKMSKSSVVVDLEYLWGLEADSRKLAALEAGGVDNWDGYEASIAGLNDEEKRDE